MRQFVSKACLLLAGLLLACPAARAVNTGDPAEGRAVFENQCADCHTVSPGKNKRGPHLAGIIGSPAARLANYNYSEAMRKAGVRWTPERLAQYLLAPKQDIPGTKMRLLTPPDQQEIADLIAWLQQGQ